MTASLSTYFASLAGYHVWATRHLLEGSLAGLSDDEWHRDVGLFFGSVHRTVNHLLVTDDIWFARFAAQRSPHTALDAQPHAERAPLVAALTAAVGRWGDWLGGLDAARWNDPLAYIRTDGMPMRIAFAPALGHVFNHATHHRGQLSAAVTVMGHAGPVLDWAALLQQQTTEPSP